MFVGIVLHKVLLHVCEIQDPWHKLLPREHTGIRDVFLSCSQDKIVKIDKATNSVIQIVNRSQLHSISSNHMKCFGV